MIHGGHGLVLEAIQSDGSVGFRLPSPSVDGWSPLDGFARHWVNQIRCRLYLFGFIPHSADLNYEISLRNQVS